MNEPLRTTVAVLSAGKSRFLGEVVDRIVAALGRRDEILVVWSGVAEPPRFPGRVRVERINGEAFDHGVTRDGVVRASNAQYVAFLSDDASPCSATWLEALVRPFEDPRIGAVFGRHVPRPDAPLSDRIFRLVRYPAISGPICAGHNGPLPALCPVSNANAAYRREALLIAGGFPKPCMFAEDRVAVRALCATGYVTWYAAEAGAYHSHYEAWLDTIRRGSRAHGSHDAGRWQLRPILGLVRRGAVVAWTDRKLVGVAALAGAVALRGLGMIAGSLGRGGRG